MIMEGMVEEFRIFKCQVAHVLFEQSKALQRMQQNIRHESPFQVWWANNVKEDESGTIVLRDLMKEVLRARLYPQNVTKDFLLGLVRFDIKRHDQKVKWSRKGPWREWKLFGFKLVKIV